MRKNLLAFFTLLCTVGPAAAQAPDFTVTDSGGKVHHLYADYVNKGKVVVLEVFFINCPPCSAHAPHLQGLYQQMKSEYGDRVEFLLLSDKSADTNPLVQQYRAGKSLTMPAVGSDGGSVTAVQPYKTGQFGAFFGTPTFVVIAPGTGQVFYDIRGNNAAGTMQLLRQKIAELLPVCRIHTPSGDTLKTYSMTLSVPGGSTSVKYTVTNGAYTLEAFPGLPALPYYEAVPTKNDNPLNGVSTFDLVLINRQILGLEPFQHAWQFNAADVNRSNSVSTIDIVELRKLILGIYDTLPQVPAWVFSPEMDTLYPQQCPEFLAIKKGDVNGSADPGNLLGAETRHSEAWPVFFENQNLIAGQTRTLRLFARKAGQWSGFQAAFRFDADAVQILDVRSSLLPELDESAWYMSDGRLSVSWLAPGGSVSVPEGFDFLELDVLPLRSGPLAAGLTLEETPLKAEVYGADGRAYPMEVHFAPAPITEFGLTPNPARDRFSIFLKNDAASSEFLQMVDAQGRVVFEKMQPLESGPNRLEIAPGNLSPGLYVVRLGGLVLGRLVWE
jgi:thiol-disulfide isomerase/thioredoxin